MPIQLAHENEDTGLNLPASYWKVTEINFQPEIFTSHVVFSGYVDIDAYTEGKRPFSEQRFDIIQQPLDLTPTVGEALVGVETYALANLPFFAGGSIV